MIHQHTQERNLVTSTEKRRRNVRSTHRSPLHIKKPTIGWRWTPLTFTLLFRTTPVSVTPRKVVSMTWSAMLRLSSLNGPPSGVYWSWTSRWPLLRHIIHPEKQSSLLYSCGEAEKSATWCWQWRWTNREAMAAVIIICNCFDDLTVVSSAVSSINFITPGRITVSARSNFWITVYVAGGHRLARVFPYTCTVRCCWRRQSEHCTCTCTSQCDLCCPAYQELNISRMEELFCRKCFRGVRWISVIDSSEDS